MDLFNLVKEKFLEEFSDRITCYRITSFLLALLFIHNLCYEEYCKEDIAFSSFDLSRATGSIWLQIGHYRLKEVLSLSDNLLLEATIRDIALTLAALAISNFAFNSYKRTLFQVYSSLLNAEEHINKTRKINVSARSLNIDDDINSSIKLEKKLSAREKHTRRLLAISEFFFTIFFCTALAFPITYLTDKGIAVGLLLSSFLFFHEAYLYYIRKYYPILSMYHSLRRDNISYGDGIDKDIDL